MSDVSIRANSVAEGAGTEDVSSLAICCACTKDSRRDVWHDGKQAVCRFSNRDSVTTQRALATPARQCLELPGTGVAYSSRISTA